MAYDSILNIGIFADEAPLLRTLRYAGEKGGSLIKQAINAHTQPLGRITGEANEFQKSLAASNARVIAFGASAGAIFAVKSAFQQLIHATIDVEKQVTELNAIFQVGSSGIKKFSNELFQLANAYGQTFEDASKAALEFARQGQSVEATLERTAAALALARISGLGMEESVSSLTAIINTFSKEAVSAMDIVNRMTAVDQSFAISAGAMADALSRVSSAASDANVSLNETMGLIAAAKQITARTGSVIGNSFKTMFTRLQRPQVIDDLESVGVKARDAQGKIRPMMDILRALSSTYDSLASSQKSFIAETVGGVYQINVLKAIMRDLGSGMSIVDGAMNAAANSTDFVDKRMAILNQTISSQLIRTGNELTQTFSNIGTALAGSTMRAGIGSFEKLITQVGHYTDSTTASSGSGTDKFISNGAIGLLRGAGNFIKGPGAQFLMYTLIKLYQRLEKFIVDSAKDLAGVNQSEKERQAINESIASWLTVQKERLTDILTGQKSITSAASEYVNEMKDAASAAKDVASISTAIGSKAITQIAFTQPRAASGYIPNLEIEAARRGGYQAGNVVNTTIENGLQRFNVTANSAESISRVIHDGKPFDFINPPKGTPAGNAHQAESIRRTGIDPFSLKSSPIMGKGFVPNLVLNPEIIRTIEALGIDTQKDILKGRNPKYLTGLPDDLVATFVNRYRSDTPSLTAALKSMVTKATKSSIPTNATEMYDWLRGFILTPQNKEANLFPDIQNTSAVRFLAQAITGSEVIQSQTAAERVAKAVHLRTEDVQKIFDLHAKSFPFVAAYESSEKVQVANDRPDLVSTFKFPMGEKNATFNIPTPLFGHKTALKDNFAALRNMMKAQAGARNDMPMSDFGKVYGAFFDYQMREKALAEGVPVGEAGSPLDIHGPASSILSQTNIKHAVAGIELKASAVGAESSGNMAEKIFRTLAGEPGTGGRKPLLKGPVGYVPPLVNIQQFDAHKGGIGIIDADKYGEGDSSTANYQALMYAAVASGKPIRVHYGPMTTGKTTAAEKIVEQAGGLNGKGGGYVTHIDDIDSAAYKQFIINKTDRKNIDSGVFGLALSAAAQIRGFYHPYSSYADRRAEMVRRLQERNRGQEGKNAEAIGFKYDEKAWSEYGANIQHMGKKFGSRMAMYNPENPMAAGGFIPNLALHPYDQFMRDQEPDLDNIQSIEMGGMGSEVNYHEKEAMLDIGLINRRKGEANPWLRLKKLLQRKDLPLDKIEAGTIVGPLIPKVLDDFMGMVKTNKKFAHLKGTELAFHLTPAHLMQNAVDSIHGGQINYKQFGQMQAALKNFGVDDLEGEKVIQFSKTLANGFVPNFAVGPDAIAPLLSNGLSDYSVRSIFMHTSDAIRRRSTTMEANMSDTERAEAIAEARRYAEIDRNTPSRSNDTFWQTRIRELRNSVGRRGIVSAFRHGLSYASSSQEVLSRLTPAQRRLVRQASVEFANVSDADAYGVIDSAIKQTKKILFPPASPHQMFQQYLEGDTPTKTELVPKGNDGSSAFAIKGNSSRLTVDKDKDLYVDFLYRRSYLHKQTGQIFHEANPLKAIWSKIKSGDIKGIGATVIGPKIPAIVAAFHKMGKAGELPKGFNLHASWTPTSLENNAQEKMRHWASVQEQNKEYIGQEQRDDYFHNNFREITGYMDSSDHEAMVKAMEYFGHRPDSPTFTLNETFAKGYIPNIFNAAAKALARENAATGGNARLSSDPLLRTSQNPFGLAAIDSRSQSNAGEAMHQHMELGQSMSQVRSAHTAGGGFIPNLAAEPTVDAGGLFGSTSLVSSVMLALLSSKNDTGPTQAKDVRITKSFSIFYNEMDKAAAHLRMLDRAFAEERNKLISGETVVRGGREFRGPTSLEAFDKYASATLTPLRKQVQPYIEKKGDEASRLSKLGLSGSITSSVAGGIAAQFAQSYGGNRGDAMGAAIDELAVGATTASQTLIAFPNKLGKIGAISIAVGAFVSAMGIFTRDMQTARSEYEIGEVKFKLLTSQMDSLVSNLSQYDSLIMDASVSFEAIERGQRKYAETLSALAQAEGGSKIAARVALAPDTKTRMAILQEEREKAGRKHELEGSVLSLQEYANKRTVLTSGISKILRVNPLGYANETQQTEVRQLVRGAASSSISSMSSPLKAFLSTSVSAEDFSKKLKEAAENTGIPEMSESAKELTEAFQRLGELIGSANMGSVNRQIVQQMSTERRTNTPKNVKALKELRNANEEDQLTIEASLNRARTAQRLFTNAGSLQAGNVLDVRAASNQEALNRSLVSGPNSVAIRQGASGVYRQQFGERSVKAFDTATELKRINAERGFKVGQVENETTRSIVGSLTRTFESLIKNPEQYKEAFKVGGALPTSSEYDINFVGKLNTAIAKTVQQGDLSRFRTPEGSIDTNGIIKAIVSNSGGDRNMQANMLRYLQATAPADTLQAILEANKQIVGINQEALTESQKQTIALDAFNAEMDFKQLSNYMGGIKNLLDRNSRRSTERSLVRGSFLMTHGKTAEARASGAAQYLGALKDMGVPIDPSKNTSLSKSIKFALETGSENLGILQQQMVGRIQGGANRVTDPLFAGAMQELGARAGTKSGTAAFQSSFLPENANMVKDAQQDISDYTANFDNNLGTSAYALQNFASSVDVSLKAMNDAVKNSVETQARISKGMEERASTFNKQAGLSRVAETQTGPEDSWKDTAALAVGKFAPTIITGVIAGVTTLVLNKFGNRGIHLNMQEMNASIKELNSNLKGHTSNSPAGKGLQQEIEKGIFSDHPSAESPVVRRIMRVKEREFRTPMSESTMTEALTASESMTHPPDSFKEEVVAKKTREQKRREVSARTKETIENYHRQFTKDLKIISPDFEAAYIKPPASDARKTSLFERWLPKAKAGDTKAIEKMEQNFGKMRGVGKFALPVVALMALGAASSYAGQSSSTGGAAGNIIGTGLELGVSTGANAIMLKTPSMSKLGSLKAGGAMALTDFAIDKIGDKIGGTKGTVIKGLGSIASAGAFFGARGAGGAGIGLASEALRGYTEKKLGYGAGLTQGFAGAVGAGAMYGGPVGSAVNAGIYLGAEGLKIHSETVGALGERGGIDQLGKIFDVNTIKKTTEANLGSQIDKVRNRLTGRARELNNRKDADQDDTKGFYGQISRLFSSKQFNDESKKELVSISRQLELLNKAKESGDNTEMLEALKLIHDDLIKQIKGTTDTSTTPPPALNSALKVDISLSDSNISSEIDEKIIGPLRDQLMELRSQVNELRNQNQPRPSRIGG